VGVWGLGCRVWETSAEKEQQQLRESPSYGGFEELSAILSFAESVPSTPVFGKGFKETPPGML